VSPELKARIDGMTREDMAWHWRFAPIGSPLFQDEAGLYFEERFKSLGGFSPEISKRIGWDKP